MSSTVCQSPQAQHSHVMTTAPAGTDIRHACATFPSVHPLHPHTQFFSKTVRGYPQISTPSLGGVGTDLDIGRLAMSGLSPDLLFNSKPSLRGCAESWRACAASPLVLNTISVGYTLQFARPPPRFRGVVQSVVPQGQTNFLQQEIDSLLRKGAILNVPPKEINKGFYSRYFLSQAHGTIWLPRPELWQLRAWHLKGTGF